MSIIYKLDLQPTEDAFKELVKKIAELYPEYAEGEKKTYADGSGYAKFQKGEYVITAERDLENKILSVTCDEELTELAELYRLKKKDIAHQDAQAFFKSLSMGAWHFFFGTSRRIKFIFVPAVILLPVFVYILTNYGGVYLIVLLEMVGGVFLAAAIALGWIWLIPGGIISAGIASVKTKTPFACKAAAMSLPVISAAYFVSHAAEYLPELADDFSEAVFYIPMLLLYDPLYISILLLIIYILALPYMIIDEIAGSVHKNNGGGRYKVWQSAIGWVYSAAAAAALTAGCAYLAGSADISSDEALRNADRTLETAKYELIETKYHDDMQAVAEYALERSCFDWQECPDERLEEQWRKLFEENSCRIGIGYSEQSSVRFTLDGVTVTVYPYEDSGTYTYGGDEDEYYL
ncbi:MAG: hypothetical protein NC120_01860 [Ruminococcus sp.]|nr:hypothetical protein [Ruminococcus sp.]